MRDPPEPNASRCFRRRPKLAIQTAEQAKVPRNNQHLPGRRHNPSSQRKSVLPHQGAFNKRTARKPYRPQTRGLRPKHKPCSKLS